MDKKQLPDVDLNAKLKDAKELIVVLRDKLTNINELMFVKTKLLENDLNNNKIKTFSLDEQELLLQRKDEIYELKIKRYELIQNIYSKQKFIDTCMQHSQHTKKKK